MKKIIKENKYSIVNIIKNFTGREDEDIEQEVYIKVWKSQKDGRTISKLSHWINKITANTCKDFLRSKYHKQSEMNCNDEDAMNFVKDEKTPEKTLNSKQRQEKIMKAINELPKKMKEVIILYEFEQMSYDEISVKLKIPIGTVKSRISCARTVLKEELKDLLEE